MSSQSDVRTLQEGEHVSEGANDVLRWQEATAVSEVSLPFH